MSSLPKEKAVLPATSGKWRTAVSVALILLGTFVGVVALALISNRFGNTAEVGLLLFAFAGWILVTGICHFFFRMQYAAIVGAIASPFLVGLLFVVFWASILTTAFQHRDHPRFAANGVSQIQPALQMNKLYDDCRHFITYGPSKAPLFNSVAYFGDRYELTMQVPVKILSDGTGKMTGEPQFYLSEVSKVTVSPSGQIGAQFSGGLNFDSDKWKKVYGADGDLSKIGFNTNPTGVPNFKKYADASRPSD